MDLSQLVREHAEALRATLPPAVTLQLRLGDEPAAIEADPGRVGSVVADLVGGAVTAIGPGPGAITLAAGVAWFDDAYLGQCRFGSPPPAGRFAYAEVSDTGPQGSGRTPLTAAALEVVRELRGALVVGAAPGQGVTARVLFPAAAVGAALAPGGATPAALPGSGPAGAAARPEGLARLGTILVADDEAALRRLCAAFAQRLGLRTLDAANGEEAVALLQARADEIGCVLLDLTMPRMDGLRAFREIKRLGLRVPVVLCSGYEEKDATRHFTEEGLAGFLRKPFNLQDLRRVLEQVGRLPGGGATPGAWPPPSG